MKHLHTFESFLNESNLNESSHKYAVVLTGGSIGDSPRPRDARGYVGMEVADTEELYDINKAKEKAKRMNKDVLSPGEKRHYGLKYITVPVKDGKYIKESFLRESSINEALSFDEIKDKYLGNPYGIGANVIEFVDSERGNPRKLIFRHEDKFSRDRIESTLKSLGIPAKKMSKSMQDKAFKYRFELHLYESVINEKRISFKGNKTNQIYNIVKGNKNAMIFAKDGYYSVDAEDMRNDLQNPVVIGLDQDGGEHNINVSDIEFIELN